MVMHPGAGVHEEMCRQAGCHQVEVGPGGKKVIGVGWGQSKELQGYTRPAEMKPSIVACSPGRGMCHSTANASNPGVILKRHW